MEERFARIRPPAPSPRPGGEKDGRSSLLALRLQPGLHLGDFLLLRLDDLFRQLALVTFRPRSEVG